LTETKEKTKIDGAKNGIRHEDKMRACLLAEGPMSARPSIVIVAPNHGPDLTA
jgi:hypothetical protein